MCFLEIKRCRPGRAENEWNAEISFSCQSAAQIIVVQSARAKPGYQIIMQFWDCKNQNGGQSFKDHFQYFHFRGQMTNIELEWRANSKYRFISELRTLSILSWGTKAYLDGICSREKTFTITRLTLLKWGRKTSVENTVGDNYILKFSYLWNL